MYWPIGLPRIYAASSSRASDERVVETDDDALSIEIPENSSLLRVPSSVIEAGHGEAEDAQDAHPELLSPTPITPGIKPLEHEFDENTFKDPDHSTGNYFERPIPQIHKEPILALRLSRTGFIFATITATSLTIWQTKVIPIPCSKFTTHKIPAHCHSSRSNPIRFIIKHIRTKYISTRQTRFGHLCRTNHSWIPHHLYISYRSRRSSI
jgi:hypothetical protein